MTLRDLARKVLAESLLPLTAKQVWEEAVNRGLDKQVETKGKTPDASVTAYLYTQAKKPSSGIVATGSKPAAFSLVASSSPSTGRGSGRSSSPSVANKIPHQNNQPRKDSSMPPKNISAQHKMWGIHSRDDALFRHENLIAIGWKEMGDLSILPKTRDAFKKRLGEVCPDVKKAAIPTDAGMLYRFIYEVEIGDYVIYPSKQDRKINVGIVEGPYFFNPDEHYAHQRKVKWIKQISRDLFSPAALYEVGSAMTFFSVVSNADEFRVAINRDLKSKPPIDWEKTSTPVNPDSILEATKDFLLKELSTNLKGFALEAFVANLLQAMGYRTILSKKGGDNGIDIVAYKDELPPRILVQVKSKDGDINRSPVSQLHGDLKTGDYGLFVTLSNFTPNAIEFLKETPRVKAINGGELAELVLKYYDKLDEKFRKIIPLKMVYVPAPSDESDSDSD